MAADILALLSQGLIASSGGSPDYPAAGDVRAAVAYGSGAYTGTLTLPAVTDVRSGITFGAAGTEYTGTLTVGTSPPPPPPLSSATGTARQHSGEWKFWPARENVTLRVLTGPGLYDAHPLTASGGAVKRRAPTWKEITSSGGGTSEKNLVWLLPTQNLPEGIEPRAGSQIRSADDVDHTVLDVQSGKFAQTWRCVTIALAVVYELHATGVLLRPDGTRDAAGRAAPNYTEVARVKCRVQPQDSAGGEHFGRVATAHRLTALIDAQVRTEAHDVFRVTSYVSPGGAIAGVQDYTVLGYRSPERLDQLCAIDLERIA